MITNINLKENNEEKPTIDIYIYNSIKSGIISKKIKSYVTSKYRILNKKKIVYHNMECEQQTDGISCGLYALSNAFAVTGGLDPSKCKYNVENLRQHLLKLIKSGNFEIFPSLNEESNFIVGYVKEDTEKNIILKRYNINISPHDITTLHDKSFFK